MEKLELERLELEAELNSEAAYKLGIAYKNAYYDENDYYDERLRKAMYWFEKALELGNCDARMELIKIYLDGWYHEEFIFGYTKRAIELIEEAEKVNQEIKKEVYYNVGQAFYYHERNEVTSSWLSSYSKILSYYDGSLSDVFDKTTFESETIKYFNKSFDRNYLYESKYEGEHLYVLAKYLISVNETMRAIEVLEYLIRNCYSYENVAAELLNSLR